MSTKVVHCLTNTVTRARVADALAAIGVQPILAEDAAEVADVARRSDALLLNCGTPTEDRFAAMRAAADAARAAGVPVVLDPVGCGASAWRTERIRALMTAGIRVVRGNVAEVASLASLAGAPALRGVSAPSVDADVTLRTGADASRALGTVVLVTGRGTDALAEKGEARPLTVAGDVLARVVGAGDVLSALVAAFCACGRAPLAAAAEAHATFAGAARAASVHGPGSFWPAFVDALASHG